MGLAGVAVLVPRLDPATSPLSYAVIGAAQRVHTELGSGYLEAAYQEALAYELTLAGVPFEREAAIPIQYRDITLRCNFRADFVVGGRLIVELKAIYETENIHTAQVIHYLKSSGIGVGLLLNFGSNSLGVDRLVYGHGHETV